MNIKYNPNRNSTIVEYSTRDKHLVILDSDDVGGVGVGFNQDGDVSLLIIPDMMGDECL